MNWPFIIGAIVGAAGGIIATVEVLAQKHANELRRQFHEGKKAGFLEGRMERSAAPFTDFEQ